MNGRDRFRREIRDNPRYDDEKSGYGGARPPSRNLWVGNLGHGVSEADLARHFGRFGDLDSVAYQPGRSYAFVNFAAEEDAVDAVEALQGFSLGGDPIRIEFAKADKSSHLRDESYSQRSGIRESPYSQDYRTPYAENSSLNDKNAEPSPVLWVGFPASLKVDETVLRRAFAPFGPVEKITAFPGRSYAFIRFESIVSACNAKDALHGKLFGNPRVHICFAKNESRSSTTERGSMNDSPSSHFKFSGRQESSENYRRVENYASNNARTRSPPLFSNPNFPGDPDHEIFEQRRFVERDSSEYRTSPMRGKRGHLHDVPQRFPQTNSFQDEKWNYSEDVGFPHEPKRLRTVSYNPERDLPEYPYSDHREHEKHGFAGNHHLDFPHQTNPPSNRNFDGAFGYNKQQISEIPPQREWRDSVDSYQPRPSSVHSAERRNFTPESDVPSLKEWKWEGVIAKGGTPVCRARCFPVGKTLDSPLPEFLDCTARTSLDMLAKHYYQATNAWVVFFVPGSDADIGSYNEFMHYLEEKQRAAVSKLDDTTTLFLVPPSYFSEKVLKVPGKLSMSGVILTLDHTENEDAAKIPLRSNTSYSIPSPIPNPYPTPVPPQHNIPPYFPDYNTNSSHAHGGRSDGGRSDGGRSDGGGYPLRQDPRATVPNWAPASSGPYDSVAQRQTSARDTSAGYSTSGTSNTSGVPGFHPEQLAQLASSLLGQSRVDLRPSDPPPQMNSGPSDTRYGQVPQQVQRAPNLPQMRAEQSQPPLQNSGAAQEEDPQNRLQATLQLAAVLLQQIQQGKGS